METAESYLDETQARTLIDAYRILRKAFPDESAEMLLELLELCRKNDGLLVAPQSEMVMGYFRYNPAAKLGERKMIDVVKDYDIEALKVLDLREGDVVHVVGFTAPKGYGFRFFRKFVNALNPRGVSAHRISDGGKYFVLRKHVRWRGET